MPIPNFQTIMLPLLQFLADGREARIRELTEHLEAWTGLTDEEKSRMLPSGQKTVFGNRVGWAKAHLKAAGLLEFPRRGIARLTDRGAEVLAGKPDAVNFKLLDHYPEHLAFRTKSQPDPTVPDPTISPDPATPEEERRTPLEQIDSAFTSLSQTTADDLLASLKKCSPAFFERVVVRLLMAMGYGGVAGEGTVTGKSGDGGVDGVIKQDKLGLDLVCIQAKRWEGSVGRPVIQSFVGGMDHYRARKGVILTTSTFTIDGREFVNRIEGKKVVLVDGEQLAILMIEHNLGVSTTKTYAIKELSNDFFEEDA